MIRWIAALQLLAFASAGIAQETPNLVGTWDMEGTSPADVEKCGERKITGKLHITKKITARAYRGNVFMQETTSECVGVKNVSSDLTVRVRDTKVTIAYDDEGWLDDTLLLQGSTMTGSDKSGAVTHWVRQEATDSADVRMDATELNEFLDTLRPEFYQSLGDEFGTNILRNLRRTGLDSPQAREVTGETLERMTDCIIDIVREQILTLSMPLEEALRSEKMRMILQPRNIDYRDHECIYDTALNAGVIIK